MVKKGKKKSFKPLEDTLSEKRDNDSTQEEEQASSKSQSPKKSETSAEDITENTAFGESAGNVLKRETKEEVKCKEETEEKIRSKTNFRTNKSPNDKDPTQSPQAHEKKTMTQEQSVTVYKSIEVIKVKETKEISFDSKRTYGKQESRRGQHNRSKDYYDHNFPRDRDRGHETNEQREKRTTFEDDRNSSKPNSRYSQNRYSSSPWNTESSSSYSRGGRRGSYDRRPPNVYQDRQPDYPPRKNYSRSPKHKEEDNERLEESHKPDTTQQPESCTEQEKVTIPEEDWDTADSTNDWDSAADNFTYEPTSSNTSLNVNAPEYVPSSLASKFSEVPISNFPSTTDDSFYDQSGPDAPLASNDPYFSVSDSDTSKSESVLSQMVPRENKAFKAKNMWGDARVTKQSQEVFDRLEKIDEEYKEFKAIKSIGEYEKVKEVQKDLFEMGPEYSLAHCVAEDMRMGSGIAVSFKQLFKSQDDLLSQKQRPGGLALIEDKKNKRFVYYLVTKKVSNGKPTYETMWSSLQKMRDHVAQNKVKKLAVPRLGCGLDRLEWLEVKNMIEFLFKKLDVEITVCNFQQSEDTSKPLTLSTKLVNVEKRISDIEHYTLILYFSTEDSHVSEDMLDLDNKFNFLRKFKQENKKLGMVVRHDDKRRNFILYGCIVRRTVKQDFDFKAFTNCIREINKNNRKDLYEYVAYQVFEDEKDDILNDKILTILRNYLRNVNIYVCWHGKLVENMPKPNASVP